MWTGWRCSPWWERLGVGHDRLSAGGVLAGEDVRGYVIEHGRVVAEDAAEKLRADERVKAAYLGG